MSVYFKIVGEDFNPKLFLEVSGLVHHTLRVSYKGEPFENRSGRLRLDSQIAINPSEADFDHFQDQVADVITFLKSNIEKLSYLLALTCEYDAYFDFPINGRDDVAQADYLAPDLLGLTGNLDIGIMILRYPTREDEF